MKLDRRLEIASPKQIEAWLRFDFPGRQHAGMPYSQMRWHSAHFNGTDWDHRERGKAVFKLIDPDTRSKSQSAYSRPSAARVLSAQRLRSLLRRRSSNITRSPVNSSQQPHRRPGKGWADDVDYENGNADYLMFSNVSWTHPEVRSDVINWGKWMVEDISIDGFRIDAARHISYSYMREWITAVAHSRHAKTGKELFVLGEVWHGEVARILRWLDAVQQPPGHAQVLAFDAPLLYNFSHLSEAITESKKPGDVPRLPAIGVLDLRTLFRGTLIASRPHQAVTMVTNHDTQPGREFTTPMDRKLKPLFYAFILLRREGLPCVFWGDLFGTHGPLSEPPVGHSQSSKEGENNQRNILAELMMCRKLFAHGLQRDYWDSPSCIGWTRTGDEMRPGCAVVVSIGNIAQAIQKGARAQSNYKKMFLGKPGDVFYDILGHIAEDVRIDEKGIGSFPLRGPGVSVFVGKDAPGVEDFPVLLDFGLLYSSTLSSRISA